MGWGAHLEPLKTQGLWTPEEFSLHINVRELSTVCLACQVFLTPVADKNLLVLTDNVVAMFCLNKQGGACSSPLCQETVWLWEFCIAHSIHLKASHLP